jgi:NAD(P)H-hydrate epimerase
VTDDKSLPLPLYRANQARELDQIAIEEIGIPGICLMERAGSAAFEILKSHWPKAHRIIVLCGIGNNGGDGYILARLAYLAGYDVMVLQVGDTTNIKGDALIAFEAMQAIGLTAQVFTQTKLSVVDVLVDALFGTGLNREVSGKWQDVIDSLNQRTCPLLSLDIPSGLHADTGTVLGTAVRADVTITFIALKQGLLTGAAPDYCGKLYFNDLQVPPIIYDSLTTTIKRLDYNNLKTALPKRPRTAHKGQFGHVLIIGGDSGMIGAARLAAEAAARVGAGLISVATRSAHAALLNITRPEIMSHGVETAEELNPLIDKANVIAIGPGLGQTPWATTLLAAIKETEKPVIVDADGLNLLSKHNFYFKNSILTPHIGEAARLLESSTIQAQADRFATVRALQRRFGGVCLLKGAGTLVAESEEKIGICNAGNPGMATGGMGDLLTGVIAGLVAQGLTPIEATNLGVCLHAKAGDKAAAQEGERGLLPSDLIPWLRHYANP